MPRSSPAAWILAPIVASVLAIALVGTAGCAGAPASRHTVGSAADGAHGTAANVDADLRALEAERARALVAADVATLERLLAAELRYGHANGVVESRAQFLERLGSGALRYERVEPNVVTVQTAGDAALVRGTVALRALGPAGAVDATLASSRCTCGATAAGNCSATSPRSRPARRRPGARYAPAPRCRSAS